MSTGPGTEPASTEPASTEPTSIEPASIEPWLREILRCPRCHGELRDDTGPGGGPELVCTSAQCGLAYRVDDGIPVLLIDEARPPEPLSGQSAPRQA